MADGVRSRTLRSALAMNPVLMLMGDSDQAVLKKKIQSFYDESSSLWESVWGEHMHHGYYPGNNDSSACHPRESQQLLIERLLEWSGCRQAGSILDVGCGIGGSTLYLAARFRANAVGITLSPRQAMRAEQRAGAMGLADHVSFAVADAMAMPYPSGSFDLVWSLESGEHMPDKAGFLQECCRVLRPGGWLILATWCHRDDVPPRAPLTSRELRHLRRLSSLYHLPSIISLQAYQRIAAMLPLGPVRTADWSEAVAPFWKDVLRSALRPRVLLEVMRSDGSLREGLWAVPLMIEGYRSGLIRYGLLAGRKADRTPAPSAPL